MTVDYFIKLEKFLLLKTMLLGQIILTMCDNGKVVWINIPYDLSTSNFIYIIAKT